MTGIRDTDHSHVQNNEVTLSYQRFNPDSSAAKVHQPPVTPINSTSSPAFLPSLQAPPLGKHGISSTSAFDEVQNASSHDPYVPLSSVEQDFSPTSSHQHTPSTPSVAIQEAFTQQIHAADSVQAQLDALRDLRLASPDLSKSPSRLEASIPSICISPSVSPNNHTVSNASLLAELETLHIASLEEPSSSDSPRSRKTPSPSPSRRRRSGSGRIREAHRIEDEEPNAAPFHSPLVQKALSDVKSCMSSMADVLTSSNLHIESGSTIQSLHQQALILSRQQMPTSRIVGLIGDSGVGKSSLINSLLDKADLVRASSSGTACTCAVTEYIYHDRNDFIIQVNYFTPDELKRQFEELLRACRDYAQTQGTANGKKKKEEEEQRVHNTLEKKAKFATQTFNAMFKAKLEVYPGILSSMTFDHAISLMVDWTAPLLPQLEDQESFDTIEQCSSRLRELTSESEESPANGVFQKRWPLIRKLRVHLNAYILSKGLIIADLPGLRDHNSARKAITERYARQCHQIFAVARIDRAITDESLEEIFELARRANLSKIDIVCTRSEEVQIREARHDWIAERARIEELESAIKDDTREVDSLREQIVDFEQDLQHLTREERHDFEQLQQNCRKAERSKQNHDFEMLSLIVSLRNAKVSDRLRVQYQAHPIASALNIFCVSNRAYWDHRDKPITVSRPYLELSGIMQLRQYCIGIVADSRLRATINYMKDQVPAFLASVGLWVEAGSGNSNAERKQQILDAVSAIERILNEMVSPSSPVSQLSRGLLVDSGDQVNVRMRDHGRQWAESARQASMLWHGWHHSSYKSFCSNYGDHYTPARGRCCWNMEAIAHMKRDMTDVWSDSIAGAEHHLQRVLGTITDDFERILSITTPRVGAESEVSNVDPSVARSLADVLYHRKDLVLYGIEDAIEEFHHEHAALETNALAPVRTAFIGSLMEDTYHAANLDHGTGSDRRRKTQITQGFGSLQLFNNHRQYCKTGFMEIALSLQNKASQAVNQQIQLIEADLQILKDENVVLESERDPDFRRRLETEMIFIKRRLHEACRVVTTAS